MYYIEYLSSLCRCSIGASKCFLKYALEIYSMKSYIVIFIRKRVLGNQRSERCFLHVKATIHPIRIANDVLSRHRSVRVSRKNFRLLVALANCSALASLLVASQTFSEKRPPQTIREFSPLGKWKTSRKLKLDWNSFVDFTSDEES